GINQITAEAGVAKNTFYYYFPSKDDLCVTYLKEVDRNWKRLLRDKINNYKTPYDRLFAPIDFTKEWNQKNNYRGCPFLNIASEIIDPDTDIRKEVIYHKDGFRKIIVELLEELKNSDDKYSNIDVPTVTDAYYLIIEGAISACQNYGEDWPFETARNNVEEKLLTIR
ncbi:MAG: TetR/AcrR family transcriptional regulator, partial [Thermodesulfobacteriota bacterium]